MERNAAKIRITVSDNGVISLSLDRVYSSSYTTKQYEEHIKKYIECFNKSDENTPIESDEHTRNQSCSAYITYYSLSDLFSNSNGMYKMDESDMRESAIMTDTQKREAYDAPTIHMTLGNIFEEKDKEGYIKDKEPYKRFARFMDSSIWNYYAPIIIKDENIKDGSTPGRYDFSYFKYAILAIINNSFCKTSEGITNLYEINVTKEYADINERIFIQSKLMEISGHGKNVSPFLFHSEQKVKSAIKEKEQQKNEILNYKWRILLVDDHAEIPMRKGEDSSTVAKLDIIEKGLTELFGAGTVTREIANSKAKIYIESVSNIEAAQKALIYKKYEIILLDYLLDDNGKGSREYGYELLDWIRDEEEKEKQNYKKGPDNRFFFMFISAFTTAVSERLLTEGWLRSEDYWYIGEGACPINTPYLFQYRLLHIMEKRMKDMGLAKWNVKEQETKDDSAKNKQDQPSNETDIYTELINEIYSGDGIRKRANEKFQDVLDLLYHYKNLLLDTDMPSENVFDSAESVLATHFVMHHMDYEGVLEHLTQLVYLTAFGTVRQWPEMWEEYQFLKSVVGRIGVIEKYIFDLKNNSI